MRAQSAKAVQNLKRSGKHNEKMLLSDDDESRKLFERCEMKAKTVVNPIIDWRNADIWDFYWNECQNHNPLYHMGYDRVGCIGCPIASKHRWKEFADFPKIKDAYIHAFDRMLEIIKSADASRMDMRFLCGGWKTTTWQGR